MAENEMTLGQEHTVRKEVLMEVGAAMNLHTQAKSIAHIDEVRQEDTMQRLLDLAKTREGLQALISLHEGKSSQG